LYLALRNISKKWIMPIRLWRQALNQFVILFPGRLLEEREKTEEPTKRNIFIPLSTAPDVCDGAAPRGIKKQK
jgi:hypothetical protein